MPLKLVSDISPEEIARRASAERIVDPLRQLTSNLMRIARGSGQPYRLPDQIGAVVATFSAYYESHDKYPREDEIRAALDPDAAWREMRPTFMRWKAETDDERLEQRRQIYEREVVDASLQIVASMLVKQIPQEARGSHDFWRWFYALRDVHQEQKARFDRLHSSPVKRKPRLVRKPKSK